MSLDRANQKLVPHYRSKDFNTGNDAGVSGSREENQGTSDRISYTVPAKQRARCVVFAGILAEIAATSSTTTDQVGVRVQTTPEGDTIQIVDRFILNSNNYVAGDRADLVPQAMWFDEGDKLTVSDRFDGDAAGAGRVNITVGAHIEEFDV